MGFRYEHNCVNVLDRERSIAFYEKALGLRVLHRFCPPDAPDVELIFLVDDRTGHMLELGCLPGRQEPWDLGDNQFHMAFVADDIEEAHALHESMGCICRDDPAAEVYFIADPDGYQIEIIPAEPKQRPF